MCAASKGRFYGTDFNHQEYLDCVSHVPQHCPAHAVGDSWYDIRIIGANHDYFDTYYEHTVSANDIEQRTKWRNQLTWIVARHANGEELTYYPTTEKHLGVEGKKFADEDWEQHQVAKQNLSKLQDMSPADEYFSPLLERLMHDLHTHIEHDKNEDMPRLESCRRILAHQKDSAHT